MASFKDLALDPVIQKNLDGLGFEEPTEIQERAIPLLLESESIDFHGQAQTGTGKTFAFGIPLVQKMDPKSKGVQGLVVAPTRELAVQIHESIEKILKGTGVKATVIYGGSSIDNQIRDLKRGVQIVIGTPGRLNDHIRRKTLNLSGLKTLVLDEADIMLDMGFKEEIEEILKTTPKERDIWLFSATVKAGISQLMRAHMTDTVSVRVSQKQIGSQSTEQFFCIVPYKHRLQALIRFIEKAPDFYGFVFCQTKLLTAEIAEELIKRGYNAGSLHGDMSQAQRNSVIKKFKQKRISVLVATDVAARGIDVSDISHVINYSIPDDQEGYVHRVGRTGRAGKKGTAITFATKSELRVLRQIEKKFNIKLEPIDVPTKEQIVASRVVQATDYLDNLVKEKTTEDVDKTLLQLVDTIDKDHLKLVTAELLSDKFLQNLGLEDVNFAKADDIAPDQWQEISLNVGSDEDLNRDDIRAFLTETDVIKSEQIKSVRVLKRKTFVKLSGECSPALLNAFKGKKLGGRRVHVNLTCLINADDNRMRPRGGGRFKGGGGRRSSRQDGGRRPYNKRRN
jgi:ATP-dependent RNA helicase DeaD